jgi:alpha-1,6-mannosyltransferase
MQPAPNVTLVEGYGPALTRDPSGYRLLLDYFLVFRQIRRVRPDVLEAGDPWLTGLFCLFLKKSGLFKGLLVSFYHSDPVPSYFEPWAARGALRGMRRSLIALAAGAFYRFQRGYDLTVVSSQVMETRLRSKGVRAIAHLPFGTPSVFMRADPDWLAGRGPGRGPVRILYAGRLDPEKGVDLLLEALPSLLRQPHVSVTVIGRGRMAPQFAAYRHARFSFPGFIDDAAKVLEIYDSHHVLAAPGPYETFGLGVLEAMARGLVVVGPDAGGTAELLRQAKSPFIFKMGDGGDFLRALDAAMVCDWAAETSRSRALALRYGSWDDSIGRMIDRYSARLGMKPA